MKLKKENDLDINKNIEDLANRISRRKWKRTIYEHNFKINQIMSISLHNITL